MKKELTTNFSKNDFLNLFGNDTRGLYKVNSQTLKKYLVNYINSMPKDTSEEKIYENLKIFLSFYVGFAIENEFNSLIENFLKR